MNYFDVQVNGYGGVDFNQEGVSPEGLHTACEMMRRDGVEGFLATIITEDVEKMCSCLARLVALRSRDSLAEEMLAGFHIEGPFINPEAGYRGAHPPDAIRPADADEMKRLLDAAGGLTRVVTLAPEQDEKFTVTKLLAKRGITVAAGHCNPSYEDLQAAVEAGVSLFTHLGNGTPPEIPRHDNIIQCALALSEKLYFSLIADGVHLPHFVLRNFFQCIGLDRCIITTDAIAPAGLGPGRYTMGRWNLLIDEDLVARSPDGSHLVGSAMSMSQAEKILRDQLHLKDEDIRKLTYENPKKAICL
ncbi:MAG: N-acetylglucosamine-6-phosphate deacetylase [Phycisphaerae bacterium]|nr:N-acetylglucosamine-6-phosphate deacetylase [Phycisphaerae bacterium]